MTSSRDPGRAARLLTTERETLLPALRRTDPSHFDRPTVCTGWSVRDVLAHCAAALTRVTTGNLHRFTPEDNEADVEERRSWPVDDVLAELDRGYRDAAEAVAAAGGRLDRIALGEWIHGGDVREALNLPNPYASAGVDTALVLLEERSRERRVPATNVYLPRHGHLRLGSADADATAELTTDVETLVRLCGGRRPDRSRYRLVGAHPEEYVLFD